MHLCNRNVSRREQSLSLDELQVEKIVFKKLKKNLCYLEGKPGGNATEVNATVWEELTDDEMPDLFDRTYESSSSDDDSSDDDGMPTLVDCDCESSESSDDDLPKLFGNVYISVFMDKEVPTLSSTRSWADAVLN